MNKYQSALTNLHNRAMRGGDRDGKIIKQTKLLQELVDKATPKKVIIEKEEHDGTHYDEPYTETHLICPTCKSDECYNKYCPICGQALDWSEE